ncbi:hypothetical protein BH09SUM1_BH09SUM1_07180 [soil metagenome]
MIVRYNKSANRELISAGRYYKRKSGAALAERFLQQIEDAEDEILAAPERWPLVAHGVRRYLLPEFPYIIHYVIRHEVIRIMAVAHTSRREEYWLRRLEDG